jgi:hypothetical protein
MRMSRHMGVYTPVMTITITLNGAPGETITYSGTESGTTTLNSSGSGSLAGVKPGSYTFKGGVSGYSKTATINVSSTVNVWPAGAIYWYGREVVSMSTAINAAYSTGNATERANYIELYGWTRPDSVKTSIAQTISANTVNTSGYSSIKFDVTPVSRERANGGYAQFDFGYKSATTNTVAFTGKTLTAAGSRTTYSIATPGGSVYIGARAYTAWNGYTGNKRMQAYVHAIWME